MTKAKTETVASNKRDVADIGGIPVYCRYDEAVEIEKVTGHPRNPNRHGDEQIALLAKIIQNSGWRNPICVSNRSGFVIKGHARLMAARVLGVTHVPVEYQDYDTEAAEYQDMIADNRIAELAERDMGIIKELLEELEKGANDMDLTGYAEAEIERLMMQFHVDEVGAPELKDGDRAPFRQATFTLHDEQWEEVEAALAKAKKDGGGQSALNENSNGNALAWICGRFNRG
jgi:ParB-like chromosome segregation protein Spo0J